VTETQLDWAVLALALGGAFFYIPLYLRANTNGTRPYALGNIALFALFSIEASVGMFLTNGSIYPLIRLTYAALLYGITIWAVFGKERKHA
jgi:hypothetical protein